MLMQLVPLFHPEFRLEPFGSRVYLMELPDSDMDLYCGLQHHVEDHAQHTLARIGVHLRALQTEWQKKPTPRFMIGKPGGEVAIHILAKFTKHSCS
jgi:hypothetical protein